MRVVMLLLFSLLFLIFIYLLQMKVQNATIKNAAKAAKDKQSTMLAFSLTWTFGVE